VVGLASRRELTRSHAKQIGRDPRSRAAIKAGEGMAFSRP
jgi:hypothetical protein